MPKILESTRHYRHYRQQRSSPDSLEESAQPDNAPYFSNNAYYKPTTHAPIFQIKCTHGTHDEERQLLWLAEAHQRASGRYALQRPGLDPLRSQGRTIYDAPPSPQKRTIGGPRVYKPQLAEPSPSSRTMTLGRRRSLIDETLLQTDKGKVLRTFAESLAFFASPADSEGHDVSSASSVADDSADSSSLSRSSTPSLMWSDGMDIDSNHSDTTNASIHEEELLPSKIQQASSGFDIRDLLAEPTYGINATDPMQSTRGLSPEFLEAYTEMIKTWKCDDADELFDMFINTDICQKLDSV